MAWQRYIKRALGIVVVLALFLTLDNIWQMWVERRIPIGYATTRVTGPLRPDGTVNYRLALDAIEFRGVTPANNAVIPLLHALGTGREVLGVAANRRSALRRLGMKPLAAKATRFVNCWNFSKEVLSGTAAPAQRRVIRNRMEQHSWPPDAVQRMPWRPVDHPHAAEWIKLNRRAMYWALIASTRSQYAMPVALPSRDPDIGDRNLLTSGLMPWLAEYRELGSLMVARAMEDLGQHHVAACEHILLALHRLARLEACDPRLIARLVAMSVDALAQRGDQAVAADGRLTRAQAQAYHKALAALPPFPSLAAAINLGWRFDQLDMVAAFASGRAPQVVPQIEITPAIRIGVPINYGRIARRINHWCDRMVKALDRPTYLAQAAAVTRIVRSGRKLQSNFTLSPTVAIADELLRGYDSVFLDLAGLAGRHTVQSRITTVALALAAYHARHGTYPRKLLRLVPKALSHVPRDPFTGKAIGYRREGNGYLLWSIGPPPTWHGVWSIAPPPTWHGAKRRPIRFIVGETGTSSKPKGSGSLEGHNKNDVEPRPVSDGLAR